MKKSAPALLAFVAAASLTAFSSVAGATGSTPTTTPPECSKPVPPKTGGPTTMDDCPRCL